MRAGSGYSGGVDTSAPSYSPAGRLLRELALHAAGVAVTALILGAGLRLDLADLRAPFGYDNDSLLILPMVKETVERASPWSVPRLGAPGHLTLHDFPVVDHLHFAVIWVMGKVWPDPVVVFNLYHLLTYPLTTAAALFVLRRLGLSAPAALCGAVLYSFQPYHWLRGTAHYFLAAYYLLPLVLWVMLEIGRGNLPGFGRRRWTLAAVLICALVSQAGAYYAFFACVLFGVVGVYGWFAGLGWRAAASAGLCAGVITVGGVLAHAPVIPHQQKYGANSAVTRRPAEDAELYALKLAQMLLPVANHNPFGLGPTPIFEPATLRSMYQSPQFKPLNESDWSSLGLVGSAGLVALLAASVLPVRKAWPVGPAAALTLGGVLFCTDGGVGAIFNLMVTSQVRCHNRISIFLAFLALYAACRFLDHRLPRRLRWPAFAALIALGVWDQTDTGWFPDLRRADLGYTSHPAARAETAERYWADRAYFTQVEDLLGGGAVFTFPYMAFPEGPPFSDPRSRGKIESYEMVRGYLHTTKLRWSFGAMKYRTHDNWMRTVAAAIPIERMLERLVVAGFDGLLVDRKGLNRERYDVLKSEIDRVLGHGSGRLFHPDGRLVLFDLRPYRADLRGMYGAAGLDARSAAFREAIGVEWLGGFSSFEPTGYEDRGHWGGPGNEIAFVNPTDRPRTVEVAFRLLTVFNDTAEVRFRGDLWDDAVTVGMAEPGLAYRRRLVLPPGVSRVKVTCHPTVTVLFTDSRRQLFRIADFTLTER
jgi:hypothetical protein